MATNIEKLAAICYHLNPRYLRLLLLFAEFLKTQQDAGTLPLDKE